MIREKNQSWLLFPVIIFFIIGVVFISSYKKISTNLKESQFIIEALTDTLVIIRNKDSSQTARIMAFETQSLKDFLKIQSQESDIIRLQNLVRNNKSMLKPGSSATILGTETNVNTKTPTTIYSKDTIYKEDLIYLYPEYKSEINLSDWIKGSSQSSKDTTILNLKIKNEYDIIIGDDRNNIFQKYKPYAEVTFHNPYTDIKTVRTYKVSLPKPKRLGIGLHAGYGITLQQKPILTPVMSIGVNFNLIEF